MLVLAGDDQGIDSGCWSSAIFWGAVSDCLLPLLGDSLRFGGTCVAFIGSPNATSAAAFGSLICALLFFPAACCPSVSTAAVVHWFVASGGFLFCWFCLVPLLLDASLFT
ncbi:hypothetical protein U1Q18_043054 [Sarracenia purpurea var. burkii]